MSYLKTNSSFWNRKYYSPNVEGFIFRLKPKLLDLYIKKNKKLKVLDFGCGEGSNINYLINTYKYDGYGVDISSPSIKVCHKKIKRKKKFKLIKSEVNENDNFFNCKFDLIISIQTLYYLSNSDLNKRLINLNNMLKPGGYVFFTMKSEKCSYFRFFSNKKRDKHGLTKVNLNSDKKYKKRQKQPVYSHYINFTKNENELKKRFKIFKPLNIGYYDGHLLSTDHSGHHYTFFGKKIK